MCDQALDQQLEWETKIIHDILLQLCERHQMRRPLCKSLYEGVCIFIKIPIIFPEDNAEFLFRLIYCIIYLIPLHLFPTLQHLFKYILPLHQQTYMLNKSQLSYQHGWTNSKGVKVGSLPKKQLICLLRTLQVHFHCLSFLKLVHLHHMQLCQYWIFAVFRFPLSKTLQHIGKNILVRFFD